MSDELFECIVQDFQQCMSATILEVVNVGLHLARVWQVLRRRVVAVERELDIRFSKLHLLIAVGGRRFSSPFSASRYSTGAPPASAVSGASRASASSSAGPWRISPACASA